MKNLLASILLTVTIFSVFKSATPFLSYKANYEFIFTEMCEMRGTSNHDDCDGFCYLRKKVHSHEDGGHSDAESSRTANSHLFSSIYGLIETDLLIFSPFHSNYTFKDRYSEQLTLTYQSVPSPPPRV